jgi:DNA invertase Pin-like site-specific DNA recombinase
MSLLLGISEMERQNIRENIVRGLHRAKQKGIQLGGSDPQYNYGQIVALKGQGKNVSQIARHLGCARQTVYYALRQSEYQPVLTAG